MGLNLEKVRCVLVCCPYFFATGNDNSYGGGDLAVVACYNVQTSVRRMCSCEVAIIKVGGAYSDATV